MEKLFNLEPLQLNFIKPFFVELIVDDKNINLQIDTGSGIFAMPMNNVRKWKFIKRRKLSKTNLQLRTYNGTTITPVGMVYFQGKYRDFYKTLDLYIVKEMSSPIMSIKISS